MQKRRGWHYRVAALLAVLVSLCGASVAFATNDPSSSHYQLTQSQFGGGGGSSLQSCSGQYCAQASIGDPATGESDGTSHTAQFGPITSSDPSLDVIVNSGVSDLGVLTTERTASKTTTVKIRSYLSNGYILQIIGDAPKYNGHALTTTTTPSQSVPGTEQFGINLATNTNPGIGADPVQVPSSTTSFGFVTNDYKSPNLFKYVSGDTVAKSTSASGETDFTISTIVNISSGTPAGHYSGDFAAVVIPVY